MFHSYVKLPEGKDQKLGVNYEKSQKKSHEHENCLALWWLEWE